MENHTDLSTMLEFIESLAVMAVLDQGDVYTYVSPGRGRYTGRTAQEAVGRKVWEMMPDTHATEISHTDKPIFAKVVNANGPTPTSYFPRFDRDRKLYGLFFYVIVQGMEDTQNLIRRVDELSSRVEFCQQELSREWDVHCGLDNIISESVSVLRLKERIVQVVRSTSTILIEGGTSSDREPIVHSIHAMSARKAANFVRVNCSMTPAELTRPEFLGYAVGAFTGAAREDRIGRFQPVSDGSTFLDEVNLLTTTVQPKFLQILQEMEIDSAGGKKNTPIDVRVIAAPNIPPETLVGVGQFHSNPYYRLNVIRIRAPTLRERKENLPLLVDNFIHRLNYRPGMVIGGIAPGVMDLLMDYGWPGNVRKLQNAAGSVMNMADSPILRRRDFRQLGQRMQARRRRRLIGSGDFKLRPARQASERELIRGALVTARGNRVKAAMLLDISCTVLYEKMEQHQLKQTG